MTENAISGPGPESAEIVDTIIHRRRSCRHFTDEAVAMETLLRIIEAGTYAPSGSNTQNVRYLVMTDPKALERLDSARFVWPYRSYVKRVGEAKRMGLIGRAPAAILVYADASLTGTKDGAEYHVWRSLDTQNACAAIENMLLMATALGVGTTWISASEVMGQTRMLLGSSWQAALPNYDIPDDYHIQGIVILGYPKRRDDAGFPSGEGMHGVDWTPTERQPVTSYLIDPAKDQRTRARVQPDGTTRLQLKVLSAAITRLLRLVYRLERRLLRLEKPYLTSARDRGNG
ncbi:MAG: nitroreductase family protein [Pseudomonadota bacterium]